MLWGGDAGYRWAESKYNAIKRARESQGSLIDRELSIDLEVSSDMAESRPAPKKDQIEGSDENKPGSAGGPGGDIKLSEAVEKSLRNKLKEHNDKMKDQDKPDHTRTTYGQLAAVYRRGAGAYSTSHRPGKTRGQWAMARVNAYLYLLRNGRPENPKYTTDYDLLPKDHPKSTRGNATTTGFDQKEKRHGGVAMDNENIKVVDHALEEEVVEMAWMCDGMEHANCEQQEDGSWMCGDMEHSSCEKMSKHEDEEENMKYPKDEEDMSGHDDEEENMSGHDEDEEDMSKHEDEEDMSAREDEEDMAEHHGDEEEENMSQQTFMRTPMSEVQENVVKQFRESMGDDKYVVQWSWFDDMIVFWNGEDGEYYRVDFVMNNETETLTFGEPVLVKPRYITEAEMDELFPEQPREDRGGQLENATEVTTDTADTAEQKGLILSESEAAQLEKDMAELQAFRKEDKLKLVATFEDLVDKEVYTTISEQVDEFTKEELETKLSVEAMKKIKAEKELEKTQTINPVKFYTGSQENNAKENPVASLIDQWKDKK